MKGMPPRARNDDSVHVYRPHCCTWCPAPKRTALGATLTPLPLCQALPPAKCMCAPETCTAYSVACFWMGKSGRCFSTYDLALSPETWFVPGDEDTVEILTRWVFGLRGSTIPSSCLGRPRRANGPAPDSLRWTQSAAQNPRRQPSLYAGPAALELLP